tara:strand:+ start:662 stop:979 length:318 start_codon:yes stop_codon:yes gene_type:complete
MKSDVNKREGAKSYRAEFIDSDTFRLNINLRFLFNSFCLFGAIIGSAYSVKSQIDDTARRVSELESEVKHLREIHDQEIKEIQAWYKRSLEIDLNPLNILKRKKK